jgi:hypothetical protein
VTMGWKWRLRCLKTLRSTVEYGFVLGRAPVLLTGVFNSRVKKFAFEGSVLGLAVLVCFLFLARAGV